VLVHCVVVAEGADPTAIQGVTTHTGRGQRPRLQH
jgi:hypothetical protein